MKHKSILKFLSISLIISLLTFFITEASEATDLSLFKIKDGFLYKDVSKQDNEVTKVPANIKGPVRYFSVYDGVMFFAEDGQAISHLELDGVEEGAVKVIFSPDGKLFLLETGPMYLPEAVYDVYFTDGLEKKGQIDGWKGATWIDPLRFVTTRIDDARSLPESTPGRAFAYRTSVVIYDSSTSKIFILKESTGTQNFSFTEITNDGKDLKVSEQYVNSEKNWGDEEKIKQRELILKIPALTK
ncbi:MAG: hypothetical protein LBS44_06855 [Deltaproteobacteria bacterium]|jgi:hypothetical protein|nr:hypothetical protein [Deltaproteobacteria bacterium]